jgi:phosphopantetheine adenylyltransferase
MDSDPTLDYILVPIVDPFGPSIVDERLEAIIGSEETKSGCDKVNELRKEKGLSTLDVVLVGMEKDPLRASAVEEEKLSSSSLRLRLLGRQLRPPLRTWERGTGPYVIGLTGGSASG